MRKRKFILSVLAGVSAVVLAKVFLVDDILKKGRALREQINRQEVAVKGLIGIGGIKDEIVAAYASLPPLAGLETMDEKEILTALLREIETAAKKVQGSIINLSPVEKTEIGEKYKKYKAELRIEMDFEQLIRFLLVLEESRMPVAWEKIAIMPADEKTNLLRIDGVVDVAALR